METNASPINVLVIGASGYLGSAVGRAFLNASCPSGFSSSGSQFYRVYGLVRRESAAQALAAEEITPIVASLSDSDALLQLIYSHSTTWHIIVVATEPSKIDSIEEEKHWNDILTLIKRLSDSPTTTSPPIRPVVLWSSGCKDYGTTGFAGDKDLSSHTETSPLCPHPFVRVRMEGARRALEASLKSAEEGNGFDLAIIRPTPLFGYSGSYYGSMFDYMHEFSQIMHNGCLKLPSEAGTILHGVHINDCGDAYVSLAHTAIWGNKQLNKGRQDIAGEVFNISSKTYETLQDIGHALAAEYGFSDVEFNISQDKLPEEVLEQNTSLAFGYSQWVASDKIRAVTGWTDVRPLFHQNVGVFRRAYDAAQQRGSDNIDKTRQRMAGNWGV